MCGLRSCGPRAQLLLSMWDLPGLGMELTSPALAGELRGILNHWTTEETFLPAFSVPLRKDAHSSESKGSSQLQLEHTA